MGCHRGRDETRAPDSGWEAQGPGTDAGALAVESRAEFVAARESARELDLWDAVAIALGEDEPAQTVP